MFQYHVSLWFIGKSFVSLPCTANNVIITVNFRDGIEDEWYVVSLMCQLTKQFTDLVVR